MFALFTRLDNLTHIVYLHLIRFHREKNINALQIELQLAIFWTRYQINMLQKAKVVVKHVHVKLVRVFPISIETAFLRCLLFAHLRFF